MNWLDAVLGIILIFSTIQGLSRGFARAMVGFVAAILGLILAIWFHAAAGSFVLEYVSHKSVANFLGFTGVFLLTVLAGAVIGHILHKLFKWVGLGWLDRLLGGALGFVRATFICIGIVMMICAFTRNPPPQSVVESRLAPYLTSAADVVSRLAPRELRDGFEESYEKVKKVWNQMLKTAPSSF